MYFVGIVDRIQKIFLRYMDQGMSNPKVTVLMPVYNAEKYVGEAIDSILNQTFKYFEFLIINDGSTDSSLDIIKSYNDPRIKIVNNKINLGLSHTLNKGIELSQGEYIARMDADDISLPIRLAKQIEFMDSHQQICICGSWIQTFDRSGNQDIWQYSQIHEELLCSLFYNSCFAHPSVCIRKQVLLETGLRYKQEFTPAEDYELWTRLIELTEGTNLPLVLLRYRNSENQMTKDENTMASQVNIIRIKMLNRLNLGFNQEEKTLHINVIAKNWDSSQDVWKVSVEWLEKLAQQNTAVAYYKDTLFNKYLARFLWLRCTQYDGHNNLNTIDIYNKCSLSSYYQPSLFSKAKVFLKYLLNFSKKHKLSRAKFTPII